MSGLREHRGIDINLRSGPQMREYAEIADRIAADAPGRVLDWGCGWGQVSALLHERGVDVQPIDYRPEAPSTEPQKLEHFPQLVADITRVPVALPYEDASFDAVLSCGVLEHVADPHGSLEEIRRILRPGGTFYVYKLPNRWSYLEWVAKRAGLYYHGQLPNDRVYTRGSARRLLESLGFEVREIRRTNLLPLTVDHPLAARLSAVVWGVNRALRFVPGLAVFATNVEVVATR